MTQDSARQRQRAAQVAHPGLWWKAGGPKWRPKSDQNRKKNDSKIDVFLSAFGLEDGGTKGTKTSRNGDQYGRKSIPEESAKKKRGKYENEQQSNVLARCWVSPGVENRRGNKKRVSKTIQNRRVILERIFKGFWSILVPFWNPGWIQNRKKRDQKQDRF